MYPHHPDRAPLAEGPAKDPKYCRVYNIFVPLYSKVILLILIKFDMMEGFSGWQILSDFGEFWPTFLETHFGLQIFPTFLTDCDKSWVV